MPDALILALIAAFVLVEPAFAARPSLTMGSILVFGAFCDRGHRLGRIRSFSCSSATQMNASIGLALPPWPALEGKVLSSASIRARGK